MYIPEDWFFQNLITAKNLAESGYLDEFLKNCGNLSVDDESSYELAWGGIASVFPGLCNYFNNEEEIEAIVFFDPLIDEFTHLCKLYEEREDIPFGTSALRESAESDIYGSFELYDYSYCSDFRFYHLGHGRDRMVMLMGCDFYQFDQLPTALASVRNELEWQVKKLREELAPKSLPKKNAARKRLQEAA